MARILCQPAVHFVQKFAYQVWREIRKCCLLAIAVVKRDFLRETDEFLFVRRIGADGTAMFADVVIPAGIVLAQGFFRFVRAVFAANDPQHENVSALDFVCFGQRMVLGADGAIAQIQQCFLDVAQLRRIQSRRRHFGLSVLFAHADDDVAAAQIVKVVGKGADGMQHRFGIPAFFVFNPLAFHAALVQQVFDVNRQFVGKHCL